MKRTNLKKLQLKTTTIRILQNLTNEDLKLVVGGMGTLFTCEGECDVSKLCSHAPYGTC